MPFPCPNTYRKEPASICCDTKFGSTQANLRFRIFLGRPGFSQWFLSQHRILHTQVRCEHSHHVSLCTQRGKQSPDREICKVVSSTVPSGLHTTQGISPVEERHVWTRNLLFHDINDHTRKSQVPLTTRRNMTRTRSRNSDTTMEDFPLSLIADETELSHVSGHSISAPFETYAE